eukprot:jgi/Botrbrau1/4390/Bobra.105_2s0036.1
MGTPGTQTGWLYRKVPFCSKVGHSSAADRIYSRALWSRNYLSQGCVSSVRGRATQCLDPSRSPDRNENPGTTREDAIAAPLGNAKKGSCYGCGMVLQTEDVWAPGFVDPEKYEVKRQHRQLDQLVCSRCQQLSHGAMVPGVEDMGVPCDTPVARRLVSPAQLRQQLEGIKQQKALVILLVDLLDASGSFLGRIRNLIGANPVILVGTKADLLPRGTDLNAVKEWLEATALHKRLRVAHVCLCSSRTGDGIPETVARLRMERRGRDVYIIGAANVGKSAFTRAIVREMSDLGSQQFDAAAASVKRRLPVESAMPGTTLGLIPLRAFESGGTLYDTPGLHLHHRLPHMLQPDEVAALRPRTRLKPNTVPIEPQSNSGGQSICVGGVVRLEIRAAPPGSSLTFFLPPTLGVGACSPLQDSAVPSASSSGASPTAAHHGEASSGNRGAAAGSPPAHRLNGDDTQWEDFKGVSGHSKGSHRQAMADESAVGIKRGDTHGEVREPGSHMIAEERAESDMEQESGEPGDYAGMETEEVGGAGGGSGPPERFAENSVAARGGLQLAKEVCLQARGQTRLADIAISGLPGWLTVEVPSGHGEVQVAVWAPPGVEVFVRPPMPVGGSPVVQNPDARWGDSEARPQALSRSPLEGKAEWRGRDTRPRGSAAAQQEYAGDTEKFRGPQGAAAGRAGSQSWWEGSRGTQGDRSQWASRAAFQRKQSGTVSPQADTLQWDDC